MNVLVIVLIVLLCGIVFLPSCSRRKDGQSPHGNRYDNIVRTSGANNLAREVNRGNPPNMQRIRIAGKYTGKVEKKLLTEHINNEAERRRR